MLRSDYCNLSNQSERALCDLGECPYDQVGGRTAKESCVNWVHKKTQPSFCCALAGA